MSRVIYVLNVLFVAMSVNVNGVNIIENCRQPCFRSRSGASAGVGRHNHCFRHNKSSVHHHCDLHSIPRFTPARFQNSISLLSLKSFQVIICRNTTKPICRVGADWALRCISWWTRRFENICNRFGRSFSHISKWFHRFDNILPDFKNLAALKWIF